MNALRLLVVDDAAMYRKVLSNLASRIPGIEVVGAAPNGKIALDKMAVVRPDIVTLDLEMPVLDGLGVLRTLATWDCPPAVIVVSAHTVKEARNTLEALELGAHACITKPTEKDMVRNGMTLFQELKAIMAGLFVKRGLGGVRSAALNADRDPKESSGITLSTDAGALDRKNKKAVSAPADIVVIAVSTGGPKALGDVIPKLPSNLRVPVIVVQHIPKEFTLALVESLSKRSALEVRIGRDGMALQPGTVYFAPGGKQTKICAAPNSDLRLLQVTDDPPENHCKPSADYLLRSVAELYGPTSLGVIMTGMGRDGVRGLGMIKGKGGTVIAQDKESCVVFGMPCEAIASNIVDSVQPLHAIWREIVERVGR